MIAPILKGLLREVAIAIIFITITVLTDNEDFAFSGMCFYLFYVLFETVYTVMQEKKRGIKRGILACITVITIGFILLIVELLVFLSASVFHISHY